MMENYNKVSKRANGFKWLLTVLAGLPSIIIASWFYFGVRPHLNRIENVANHAREINKNSFAEIQKIGTIDSKVLLGMNILNKEDMQSLKKILFALKVELDKAIELSHQDTINIVDRVNLYVTIGIVLLTLLGVFLPVVVQSFGREEIKELKEKLEINSERLDKKTKKFSSDIRKLKGDFNEELKKKTEMLDVKIKSADTNLKEISSQISKIDDETKNIPPLKLSYALLRALDKNVIRWYSINQDKSSNFLIGIFRNIRDSIEDCKRENISPKENSILQNSLVSFNQDLEYVKMMSQFKRMNIEDFETLSKSVDELLKNNVKNAETLFDDVIGDVDKIIKSFEEKKKLSQREP